MSVGTGRETDMQAGVYETVEPTNASQIYETLENGNAYQIVDGKRCKVISCKNIYLLFLTVISIGTLTCVIHLYLSPRTTSNELKMQEAMEQGACTDEENSAATTTATTTPEPTTQLPCCEEYDGLDLYIGKISQAECRPCVNTMDSGEKEYFNSGDYGDDDHGDDDFGDGDYGDYDYGGGDYLLG